MYGRLQEALEQRFDTSTEDGRGEVFDIRNHGISGGFSGFIYTHEITEFYNEHESDLLEYLSDMDYTLASLAEAVGAESLTDITTGVVWCVVECWCAGLADELECEEEALAA